MRINDSAINKFYGEYEAPQSKAILTYCTYCDEPIYTDTEYYRTPIWDDELPVCSDCIEEVVIDLFKELDLNSQLEALNIDKINE